jgi:putative DNA primase/helicase
MSLDYDAADQVLEEARKRKAAGQSEPPPNGAAREDFTTATARLAQLKAHEYDHVRKAEAERLGVRTATLDAAVEAARGVAAPAGQGRPLEFPAIEPWPAPVEGAALLDAMTAHLERFAVMPSPHAAHAVALWALHCHTFDAALHTPRLLITSPTRECGKSQLLSWLAGIVPRPFDVIDPTGPNLFRPIEAHQPTVLIDEGDLVSWDERHDVRMVINAGHCRLSPGVPRCVGEQFEPRLFRVWAPLAYAMIGKPADTLLSRSIVIGMKRMAPDQHPDHRRPDRDQGFAELRRKCARWADDHLAELRAADPALPVTGRRADCWRTLIAIANAIGGTWREKAWEAAEKLSSGDDEDETRSVLALADIKKIFAARDDPEHLFSSTIVTELTALEGRPWPEYGKNRKPISATQLARLLKPFGISPGSIRIDGDTGKGYHLEQFQEAWNRYLRPAPRIRTVTPSQATAAAGFRDFRTVTPESNVTVWNRPKARATASCDGVTVRIPLPEQETAELTLDDLDWRTGDAAETTSALFAAEENACAHCHAAIDSNGGFTAISSGEFLHNACVDQWARS